MKTRRQRKIIVLLSLGVLAAILGLLVEFVVYRYRNNRSMSFRAEGSQLQISRDNKWREFIVKGVYVDSGQSSNFTAGKDISKKEYITWFKEFSAMNANVIKVYSIQTPEFYKAFYQYNLLARKPLYLLHGIKVKGSNLEPYDNAYDDRLNAYLLEEIRQTIDVVHGKFSQKQQASGLTEAYTMNIAPYVMGYILCGRMDSGFVLTTNQKNTHVVGFEGDYLYTLNASPYEAWLAAVGNYVISYEQDKYGGKSRLISWTNCADANPVKYVNAEDMWKETVVNIDIEHIRTTEKFDTGIFAYYDVHPGFTDFITRATGELSFYNAELSPYESYLKELKNHHTMPILAAEFGISGSGDHSEIEQGEAIARIFDSIINFGFSGGVINARQTQDTTVASGLSYAILQKKFSEY